MKNKIKKILKIILVFVLVIWVALYFLSFRQIPKKVNYGVSFNTLYAKELKLDWKVVYDSIIDELQVKKIRLAAHWTLVEPKKDVFSFDEIDYQVKKASENNVEIILAVGKRLPRWPECHIPDWASSLNQKDTESEVLKYIEKTINRYKDNKNIKMWQVENEPFLTIYASAQCGHFDKDFLDKEIAFVKKLDPSRKVMITDSGELSTWARSYKRGDVFGTTLYVYSYNKYLGDFRNLVWPGFYSSKRNLWDFFYGKKDAIIAELSLEPWLDKPVPEETLDVQKDRMSHEKFEKVLDFAKETGFQDQYLWGAEWWYYMNQNGDSWYWDKGKEIFSI